MDKRALRPARQADDDYTIKVDDIVGLVRIVVADNQKYFIEKDSCFLVMTIYFS